MSLNSARTTDDTVVLNYEDPNSYAGEANATVIGVRYQWQGDHVQMLDPLPLPGPSGFCEFCLEIEEIRASQNSAPESP